MIFDSKIMIVGPNIIIVCPKSWLLAPVVFHALPLPPNPPFPPLLPVFKVRALISLFLNETGRAFIKLIGLLLKIMISEDF